MVCRRKQFISDARAVMTHL